MTARVNKKRTQTCPLGHTVTLRDGEMDLLQGGRCPVCGNTMADFLKQGVDQAKSGASGPFKRT